MLRRHFIVLPIRIFGLEFRICITYKLIERLIIEYRYAFKPKRYSGSSNKEN